jgi:prepilin-type N-terminal cleavage/methylation domain-containing protein
MNRDRATRDRGFTLTEVVIVVTIIAIVTGVIVAVFSVIARTTPTTERRADDARALLNLTNWIPQDVLSTAESGFDTDPAAAWSCGTPAPVPSTNLVQLKWTEGTRTYTVSYRYVPDSPNTGSIVRFSCDDSQPPRQRQLRMTPPLQEPPSSPPGTPPVDVDLVPNGSGGHRGLNFTVNVYEGAVQRDLLSLDAFTANIVTTLPTNTSPGTTTSTTTTAPNSPPIAADVTALVNPGVVFVLDVPAIDPDGDPLSITSTTNTNADLVVGLNGGLELSITASSDAPDGTSYVFDYTVSDGRGGQDVGTVFVQVTSGATGTTTTTTTSTTTTTIPCVAAIDSVTPSSVKRRTSGFLDSDVVVRITTNGQCQPLVLTFDPDPTDNIQTEQSLEFGTGTVVTIGKNTYRWIAQTHPLHLREGANGLIRSSANLVVRS